MSKKEPLLFRFLGGCLEFVVGFVLFILGFALCTSFLWVPMLVMYGLLNVFFFIDWLGLAWWH